LFFDDHPEFVETSGVASAQARLNMRHLAMIEENAEVIRGRRVVDIASHDGRWSFAALKAGAAHVTGIEGRRHLVENARKTFAAKGIPDASYRMICGDVHQKLFNPKIQADVVMCLGFLYHTARYVELMAGIASTGAEYVIIDTRVIQDVEGPLIQVRTEGTIADALAIKDRYAQGKRVISAVPSEEALVVMLDAIGFEVDHRTDWHALIARHPGVGPVNAYARGERVTFRARRVA